LDNQRSSPLTGRPCLDNIALCCIDTEQPLAAARALRLSAAQCCFAATILLTDRDLSVSGIEVRRIATLGSGAAYSRFVLKDLLAHVATPFVQIVQWDGYVLDGSLWDDRFRAFDYIGAPWYWHPPGQQVGNGGFSLRSRRLLEALASDDFPPGHPEDDLICRAWRPDLERRGLSFADSRTAARFSFERDLSPAPRFGFHGLFNFWRTVPPGDLSALLETVSDRALGSPEALQLVCEYLVRDRPGEAFAVLERFEHVHGPDSTLASLIEAAAVRGEHAWGRLVAHLGARYPALTD